MIDTRNRSACRGIADSGGFQVSTGKLSISEEIRHRLLRISERHDAALILDAPTSAIGKGDAGFYSPEQCLSFTLSNGRYVIDHRVPGRAKFLNVLQGRNALEAIAWREKVKHLNDKHLFGDRALEGVAFGGPTRVHFSVLLQHVTVLRDDGLLRNDAWLHVLGTGHPMIACALTALQDGLRETLGPGINVTFDSSTPFRIAGLYQEAFAEIALKPRGMHLPICRMPDAPRYLDSPIPWPCSSPIANRLTVGDLNVKSGTRTCWDRLSYALLAAHNVWMLSHAIALVNHRMRLSEADSRLWLPEHLIDVIHKIREVLRSEAPMTLIERWAGDLDQLARHARDSKLLTEDSDR
jgi:hypothetical protein